MNNIKTKQFESLIKEFNDQALHPPGKDVCLGAFYTSVMGMLQENTQLQEFFQTILAHREVTAKHFVNLFFRAIQYIEVFERKTLDYKYFTTASQWKEEITTILLDNHTLLTQLLLEKNTSTTKYQRYMGPRALLAHAFASFADLHVADFGCGGNFGLTGMLTNHAFKAIKDATPDAYVSSFAQKPLSITKGFAIDQDDPYHLESIQWRLACSFYPAELLTMDTFPNENPFTRKLKEIQFQQGDLVEAHTPKDLFDAVILCTMLYQHLPSAQETILHKARSALKKNGIIIVQDFARKDSKNAQKLTFDTSWFGDTFSYRTFVTSEKNKWEMLEVLQWQNGRCLEVRPGEDFEKYGTLF